MRSPDDARAGFMLSVGGGVAATGVKFAPLAVVPAGVVTVMGPEAAPAGTTAVIWVAESTVNTALTPLNSTAVVPMKLLPVMTIAAPTVPLAGIAAITGAGAETGDKVSSVKERDGKV